MFELAEAGKAISKEEFEAQVPDLRVDLINAQFDLKRADFAVLVLIAGDDRLGCNDLIDVLNEWLDARYVLTEVFGPPSDEERQRPRFWRFWRTLPPKGRIGLVHGGWVMNAIAERAFGRESDAEYEQRIEHARRFEEALAADGTLVVKLWLHLPKKALKKRLAKARKGKKRSLRDDDADWDVYETCDEALELAAHMLRGTHCAAAPWHVVDGSDERTRDLTVGTLLRDALVERLTAPASQPPEPPVPSVPARPAVPDGRAAETRGALASIDLSSSLPDLEYDERMAKLQEKLVQAQWRAHTEGRSTVLVFEGWDAAGKGGCIRRITGPLAARDYRVVPISAPTPEELAHHYLWRFWRHLPRAGRMLVFDRSWYGRVLVERVERYTPESRWRRAYEEINDFEAQLVEHGTPVVKFWLHIDREEQLARFRAREQTPYKKYKVTADDYRNRAKWDAYLPAVEEMVARTDSAHAPWHLLPANDKRYARTEVLRIVSKALGGRAPEPRARLHVP